MRLRLYLYFFIPIVNRKTLATEFPIFLTLSCNTLGDELPNIELKLIMDQNAVHTCRKALAIRKK